MAEIKYEIIKQIGVLSKSASGWAKTPSVPRSGTPPPVGGGWVGVGTTGNRNTTCVTGPRIGRRWAKG